LNTWIFNSEPYVFTLSRPLPQLIDEFEGLLCRESIQQSNKANLIGKTQLIRRAPSALDLLEIRLR